MKIELIHQYFLKCNALSIDTRKIEPNDMFLAIKGDHFDANTFTEQALQKGAAYVIIDNEKYYVDERTILVEDTLKTLQELATFHREYLKTPIVALTGSNGKTTTKELLKAVLSKKYKVSATIGNLNNHIGVPLTLLSFNKETEIGIVEMGANHQGEIAFLCAVTQPDFAYITNFGKAHLEGFGGIEGVIKGKSEIYEYITKKNKLIFLNLDDDIQVEKSKKSYTFSFGVQKNDAHVTIKSVKANPFVEVCFNEQIVKSNLIGLYNSNNINAAICIGIYFKISDKKIKEAIEEYIPNNNRSQILTKGTNSIILDAYNANPSSMKAAIDNFNQFERTDKMIILGDMFELGSESDEEHQSIVVQLQNTKNIISYFVGKSYFKHKVKKDNLLFFEFFDDLQKFILQNPIKNKMLLIKGSRGMALERVLEFLD